MYTDCTQNRCHLVHDALAIDCMDLDERLLACNSTKKINGHCWVMIAVGVYKYSPLHPHPARVLHENASVHPWQ